MSFSWLASFEGPARPQVSTAFHLSQTHVMNILVPNLDFEVDLCGRPRQLSEQATRVIDELAPLIGLLAEDGDQVLVNDDAMPAGVAECLAHVAFVRRSEFSAIAGQHRIIPWGWTEQTCQMASVVQMSAAEIPPATAVTRVNSREFSAMFDGVQCEHGELLPFGVDGFGTICRDIDDWKNGVCQLERFGFERWVAKPPISHAGRNRLLAKGTELNRQQRGWLEKHLARTGGVYLEPWVCPEEQCGLQFEIISSNSYSAGTEGRVQLVGVSSLLNDSVGRYQGSLICRDDLLLNAWQSAAAHGFLVCEAAAAAGYFGPIGIDSFRFRLPDGSLALRMCNDINARFTMGRLALQLRSSLQSSQYGAWCHFAVSDFSRFCDGVKKGLTQPAKENVSMTVTSPMAIGEQPTRFGTVLLTGNSQERLAQEIRLIHDQAAARRHDSLP